MVEGASGLLATAAAGETMKWSRSTGELRFASGALGFVYSATTPEALRGPEHHVAWCDELAKWGHGAEAVWDNLNLGLRLGTTPKIVVTTTPRAMTLLRRIGTHPGTVHAGGRTADNPHLPPGFVESVTATYGGTRLGRQELEGELLDDVDCTLFPRAVLEAARIAPVTPAEAAQGDWKRLVIGVDPPVTATGDACGIVLCGERSDGRICVLADATVDRPSPARWANAVIACFRRWPVDRVVVETNQGGLLVIQLLTDIDPAIPVTGVHAATGKSVRAEPVSVLFERGRGGLAGTFTALEDQLNGLVNGGYAGPGRSPDRADAMVYAATALMGGRAEPAIRRLGG
jgi:phage terminase large subunit-like protein